MTRDEMVDALMTQRPKDFVSRAACERTVIAVFDLIKSEVIAGNDIAISKFGTFYSAKKVATTAVNPRTGEKVDVPEKTVPKFRPAESFKNDVDKALTK